MELANVAHEMVTVIVRVVSTLLLAGCLMAAYFMAAWWRER